ncbi:hemerythrin domain-containing protein [Aquabacterium sp. A7-Y]|uniref:hemerythrin domain-containing protein n=1 Tax=Aquabacterium sp. A7-Y TaxID=1349605 RepID=UPI00223CC803|nr:hemerythrin domain-containing protein [Aquabacterium sp. A7-Y]MCW7536377.1 hemerythrin domain-containing protein [Aquabacterium sp. A7-Y]
MTTRTSSARSDVLEMLKEDHKRLKKAFRDFARLDPERDVKACRQLVDRSCSDLELHARLEEELFYPAARGGMDEPELIEEAEVEHASAKSLIQQLRSMSAEDPKFAATFTVLGEYVKHHIKEEEGELFEKLSRARVEWEDLLDEMTERRLELENEMGVAAGEDHAGHEEAESEHVETEVSPAARAGRHESNRKAAR